ncbi:MAG: hypothetical protein C4343_04035 [Chloroflexota bacterium]
MERRARSETAADRSRRGRLAGLAFASLLLAVASVAVASVTLAAGPSPGDGPSPSASVGPSPATPEGLTIQARALLAGHARAGGWIAVAVDLANTGPPISGELRAASGPNARASFARVVELPTGSQKREILYVQSPSYGERLQLTLVRGTETLARAPLEVTVHDAGQLVVGVVAERRSLVAALRGLVPGPAGAPAVVALAPSDLPERVEAWSAIDLLLWQDVDTSTLTADQLAALRTWVAGGGRLVLLGGTGGLGAVARFPDDILPFRPSATVDVATDALRNLLGSTPNRAATVPALAGPSLRGRALARVGDQVVVGEASYGAGTVTLVGFDPTVSPIADLPEIGGFWNRLLQGRGGGALRFADDSQLVAALTYLPALALPPISGLIVLLVGYIVLVGPLNYLVLRRLDRREWAWVTMPLLIVAFAAAAYGYGAVLRGSDVIINEVGIATGTAGTTDGRAVTYVGVFSPSRGTYDLTLPGGQLVAPPRSELFGTLGPAGPVLDVVEGDPARVRGLSIGSGTLRSFRVEAPASVPRIEADLRLGDGMLSGTITNRSETRLLAPAVVLGANSVTLPDLLPGQTTTVHLSIRPTSVGSNLADRVVGAYPAGDPVVRMDDAARERSVRYQIVNQLTYDPFGSVSGLWLPSDGPVLLAWDRRPLAGLEVAGTQARQLGTTLYYLTLPVRVEGRVAFGADLVRSTILATDSDVFSKDPASAYTIGQGSLTVAFRTIPLPGHLAASRLVVAFNAGPDVVSGGGGATEIMPLGPAKPIEPCLDLDQACPGAPPHSLPQLDVFDPALGTWLTLPRLDPGRPFAIAEPERYVDPATASVVFRFQNPRVDPVNFGFVVEIEGRVE